MISRLKKLLPAPLRSTYHYTLAWLGAVVYRFPSRQITVIAVTGTKGKTTTSELINAVLEEAGYHTALAGTRRFKIGEHSERNLKKMTTPGRFFLQSFLRRAVAAGCDTAILELTSEGAKQFRHKGIALDALIFTNLAPEHIESHGSYERYRDAKLRIARQLQTSPKPNKTLLVNTDDPEHQYFVDAAGEQVTTVGFALKDAEPFTTDPDGVNFTFRGQRFTSPLAGEFNIYNWLAAFTLAETMGVKTDAMKRATDNYTTLPGRVERINAGQPFSVIVDYAHTPDSLQKLYQTFAGSAEPDKSNSKLICVLGNTGGGRDKWKRKTMAEIADRYCQRIILTNEDPYDEDPLAIVNEMKEGIKNKPVEVILDRREAINYALKKAQLMVVNEEQHNKSNGQDRSKGPAVLITGKGTDPYIMGPGGTKTPWDDATVAREELEKVLHLDT